MTTDATRTHGWKSRLQTSWPWLLLASLLIPAVWHVVDFDEDIDPEFPRVERPTFNPLPPLAYRLAEPGDTLDRIMIYMSALGVAMAGVGMVAGRARGHWLSALTLTMAGLWYAATPGPSPDGWHGLGWRSMFHPETPMAIRGVLALSALAVIGVVAMVAYRRRGKLRDDWSAARASGSAGLWIATIVFAIGRQFEIPGVEPKGYWPRWSMIAAMLAFDMALLIELIPTLRAWTSSRRRRLALAATMPPVWLGLVVLSIAITWYHRPLARLKTVVPDRIYISAMPTYRGLEVAQQRRHFKTIINLFPEDTPQRSPYLEEEIAFVKEHGLHYLRSPSNPSPKASEAFLNETLRLARDPSAWPILVHCHGSVDRSPAWMGIYRFVVEKRSLLEAMQEVERHRGHRPKASVTLLYNRVLEPRAPEHYRKDPTAAILRKCAVGTIDPVIGPPRHARRRMGRPIRR